MSAYAAHFKEIIAKMPVTFEMKEVDEFCKNAKKDIKSKFNEEKKEKKAQPKKRVKKVDVDEDGNEIVKVKKPLSKYLQFLQDNRQKVIEENPGLKSKEYMSLLATLWNKHKEDNKEDSDDEDKKDSEDEDKKDSEDEDKKDSEDEDKKDSEDEDKKDSDDEDKKDSEDEDKKDSDIKVAVVDKNPCGLSNKVEKKATKAVDKQKKEKDDKKKV